MQGIDKALLPLAGRPLLVHLLERIRPQVGKVVLNSNYPASRYEGLGLQVFADTVPGRPGPLAGILTALQKSTTQWVLCVPCDTPLLPMDLLERMQATLQVHPADICVPHDGTRLHPTILLLHTGLQDSILDYLASGKHRVQDWLTTQQMAIADFSSQPEAFANLNHPADLQRLEIGFLA